MAFVEYQGNLVDAQQALQMIQAEKEKNTPKKGEAEEEKKKDDSDIEKRKAFLEENGGYDKRRGDKKVIKESNDRGYSA